MWVGLVCFTYKREGPPPSINLSKNKLKVIISASSPKTTTSTLACLITSSPARSLQAHLGISTSGTLISPGKALGCSKAACRGTSDPTCQSPGSSRVVDTNSKKHLGSIPEVMAELALQSFVVSYNWLAQYLYFLESAMPIASTILCIC